MLSERFLLQFSEEFLPLLDHCRKQAHIQKMSITRVIILYIKKGIESEKPTGISLTKK